ncbi:MAG: hypothetical protein QOI76_1777 [Frankiales bacterium]|nr:hypothetical protein [Frankiales bacterium]
MDLTLHQQDGRGDDVQVEAGDAGSIVIGWMTKLVVTFAIIGVLGFDGISVGLGHLATSDDASTAVQAASQNFQSSHNLQAAYAAAQAAVKSTETIGTTDFTIRPDGTASLTLTNTVHTLVFYRTSKTKGLTVITAHATGKYTGS